MMGLKKHEEEPRPWRKRVVDLGEGVGVWGSRV